MGRGKNENVCTYVGRGELNANTFTCGGIIKRWCRMYENFALHTSIKFSFRIFFFIKENSFILILCIMKKTSTNYICVRGAYRVAACIL